MRFLNPQNPTPTATAVYRGMTLVELLVVITIMLILLGVVLPLASPSAKARKIREAARQVNTAFASAKARSEGTGRPTGVIITPNPASTHHSFSLAYAKPPAFFTGAYDDSRASINASSFALTLERQGFSDSGERLPDEDSSKQLTRLLKGPSFLIRFNHRGRWMVCNALNGGVRVIPQNRSERALFQSGVLNHVPYQIMLPPQRSAAASIDLPTGTHIDLDHSPIGVQGDFGGTGMVTLAGIAEASDPTAPLAITFDKENGLGYVFHGTTVTRIVGQLSLLIVDADIEHDDILNPESGSMWVTVNNRTGQVKTSENLGGTGVDVNGDGTVNEADAILSASTSAASQTKAGGR